MFKLKLKHHFDAAHKLNLDYESPCLNLHGHRWEVEVEIEQKELDKNGIIIDFKQIKSIINELDHKDLNDFLIFNPTAENISYYLFMRLREVCNHENIKVTIWESPEASITYYE